MSEDGQLSMLPRYVPRKRLEWIPESDLPPNSQLVGADPDRELINQVNAWGITTPVLLEETAPGEYVVRDGKRRIKAARHCLSAARAKAGDLAVEQGELIYGWIPASVIPGEDVTEVPGEGVALASHSTIKPNPVSEYYDIRELLNEGYTEKQIAAETGLNTSAIRKRMKLGKLRLPLLEALRRSEIRPSVADEAANLEPYLQDTLVEKLEREGKLTQGDVRDAKRVQREAAIAELPFDVLVGDAEPDTAVPRPDTVEVPRERLQSIHDRLRSLVAMEEGPVYREANALAAELYTIIEGME